MTGNFASGEHFGGFRHGRLTALRQFEIDDGWQFDVDHLRPEVARYVDLRRARGAFGLHDHAVKRLGNPARVADLFLIGDTIGKKVHLFHFLEAALTDGLVRRLRRDQQHRGVIPIGRLHRRHEVRDAGAVLRDHHAHLAGGAGIAVGHHPAGGFMGAVPELDARIRENVGDRHHGGPDNAKGIVYAVHLEGFHEGFFSRHFHFGGSFGG